MARPFTPPVADYPLSSVTGNLALVNVEWALRIEKQPKGDNDD